MWRDFQRAAFVRVDDRRTGRRPIARRCWLTSETTCRSKLGTVVPQDACDEHEPASALGVTPSPAASVATPTAANLIAFDPRHHFETMQIDPAESSAGLAV